MFLESLGTKNADIVEDFVIFFCVQHELYIRAFHILNNFPEINTLHDVERYDVGKNHVIKYFVVKLSQTSDWADWASRLCIDKWTLGREKWCG